jgi:hypothetical protein
MAGTMKSAANATGRTLLGVLKLLVLALWTGGGLAVGGLATFFLERLFAQNQLPDKSGEVAQGILSSFSTTEVIAGGVLCVLLFIFERKSRGGVLALIGFGLLVVLTAVNQFIISGLQGYGIHSTIYQAIFFSQIAIALIFLSVLALAGKAAPAQPSPPAGSLAAPVIAPTAVPVPATPAPIPPPPPPVVARPGAGSPPFAQPSSGAAPPAAPVKPTSLPADDPAIDVLLGEGDPKDPGGGQEKN